VDKSLEETKVLIVEDESIVALDIKSAVLRLGFQVSDTVNNYFDAITSVKENEPDIILMDINLKNSKDGIETATDIKRIKNIPIVYLTAFCDDETLKRAIQTNPHAYLIKPFKREELKSTLYLVYFKITQKYAVVVDKTLLNLGEDYYYDENHKNIYYKDQIIKLSQGEQELLFLLVSAKGNVVTFKAIEEHIWQGQTISHSTLRTLIYRLRTKLEHKLIETIPSIGCRLIVP
jgi:DNA-binding response OmpR family regulator